MERRKPHGLRKSPVLFSSESLKSWFVQPKNRDARALALTLIADTKIWASHGLVAFILVSG